MGVTASLRTNELRVVPGQDVSFQVNVLNTGPVVDQVTVDVVGEPAAWSVVEPPALNLYPGDSGAVQVTFRPPRSPQAPAGMVPFGVRAVSREDPGGSAVEEGTVEVAAFTELNAIVDPTTSRGSRVGRHRLTVVNLGNVPVDTRLHAIDPEDNLRFRFGRSSLVADPGVANVVRVRAIPRRRFLRGPDQTRPFQVMAAPDGGEPVLSDARMVQRSLLPGWAVPAAAALLALVLVFAALWFTLLKPSIKSAAQSAVEAQLSPVAAKADQANQKAQQAQQAAGAAASAAGPGGSLSGVGLSPAPASSLLLDKPFDYRIQADAAPGGFVTFSIPGQNARPLDITDIQLQNPLGDVGIVEIRRNNVVWLRFGLANFRDYDDHFVVPVRFNKGDTVVFAVSCQNAGGKHCTPALTFSGRTTSS